MYECKKCENTGSVFLVKDYYYGGNTRTFPDTKEGYDAATQELNK